MPTLKELRRLSYLTQEALAKKAEITRETVNRFENGSERPIQATIRSLAKALNVKPEQIQFPDKQELKSLRQEQKPIPPKEHLELFLCVLDNGIRDRLKNIPDRTIRKYFGKTRLADYIERVRSENGFEDR